ncbi:hypothetical protein KCP74_14130 [Salmonella enterica subsp. enterica]|nr:hypothetical protein KCP74_14130 [Salmonella enterica subsp. enterica]
MPRRCCGRRATRRDDLTNLESALTEAGAVPPRRETPGQYYCGVICADAGETGAA